MSRISILHAPVYYYVRTKGSLSSAWLDIKEVKDMKIAQFQNYKALYESIDLYEDNKLRINRFYIDFARDSVKSVKKFRGIEIEDLRD